MHRANFVRFALLAVALAAATRAAPAMAHAGYERSTPAAGETVAAAPTRVDVWFTQELFRRAGANSLTVLDAAGTPVHVGEAEIDQSDRKHLSIALRPDFAPGTYTVRWTSLSATDGDPAEGTFEFALDPAAPATVATPAAAVAAPAVTRPSSPSAAIPEPVAPDTAAASSAGIPVWPFLAASAILLSGALGAWAIVATREAPSSGASR